MPVTLQPFNSNSQPTAPAQAASPSKAQPQAKGAAQDLELKCTTPRVALGDGPDDNPVVAIEVIYKPEDHAWRVFHHRRNGLVVARNEQYAIQDATNNDKTEWSGSLNRNRNLVMVGEVRQSADNGTFQYMERMYDRSKKGALVMEMTAQCTMALPTPMTQPNVSRQQPKQIPGSTAALPTGRVQQKDDGGI